MTQRPATEAQTVERLLEGYFARHLPRPLRLEWVERLLRKAMAIDAMSAFAARIEDLSGFDAVRAIIAETGLSVAYDATGHIPPSGRLLAVANHPLGAADVFLMLECLHQVRQDVRVVINKWGPLLLPQIAGLCLPVDRYSSFSEEARSLIAAALEREQAVILFPAGGISKITLRGIRDHRWKHGAAHFARDCKTDVLPVHISGRSSVFFLSLPRKLRHFLVARETLYPVRQHVRLRVGQPVPHEQLAAGDVGASTRRLEEMVYALGRRGA